MDIKKIRASLVVFAVLFMIPVAGYSDGSADSFEGSTAWQKLDSGTQQAWTAAKAAGDMTTRIDCFVRVRAPDDRGDESFLISKGYNARAFAGTIASGYLKAQDLPGVAGLPFVESVKIAKKKP